MPEEKYFVIKSQLDSSYQNLILDVAASNRDAGSEVLIWNQNDPPTDNQLWWEDHFHSTIRTKMNDYCLDIKDGRLVINPFKPGKEQQRWFLLNDIIRLRSNHNTCLDVEGSSAKPGAKVLSWGLHGSANQRWTFKRISMYFVIKSQLDSSYQNLILDVAESNRAAGSEVIIWTQNNPPTDNQLWWEDHVNSTIRTKMNDYCLDIRDGRLVINPFKPGKEQQKWFLLNDIIRLRGNHNTCLDVEGSSAKPGAKVLSWGLHGSANQRWTFKPQ